MPRGKVEAEASTVVTDSTMVNPGDTLRVAPNNLIQAPDGGPAVVGTMVFDTDSQCLRVKTGDGEDGWGNKLAGCLVAVSSDSTIVDTEAYEGMPVRAKKVSAGYDFSLIISGDDGMLYATGVNSYGRTGMGTASGNTTTFKMSLARGVADISAGYYHGMAVDSLGNVWAWGYVNNGRLGTATSTNTNFTFPRKITTLPPGMKGVRVEAGYQNSLVLGNNGKVYAFGANTDGVNGNVVVAGTTPSGNLLSPTAITFPSGAKGIRDIALSRYSGAAIDSTGKVYVWGNQQYGRLGVGANSSRVLPVTVLPIPDNAPIKQVALGDGFGIAFSEDGKRLYGWGNPNGWGQPPSGSIVYQRTPIEITNQLPQNASIALTGVSRANVFNSATDSIVYVTAGRFRGYNYCGSIVITTKNVYAAGNANSAGLLGLGTISRSGTMTQRYSPQTISNIGTFSGFYPIYEGGMYENTRFKQASMGYGHSLIMAKETKNMAGQTQIGLGYGTGACTYYQLGSVNPSYSPIYIFTMLKK